METVGVGILGCGTISRMHGESFGKLANARIVACADIEEKRARTGAEKWKCDFYYDLDELLSREDVHLVCILTPNALHAAHAIAAAEAKKHLLVEKPITTTIEDAQRVIDACKRNIAISINRIDCTPTRWVSCSTLRRSSRSLMIAIRRRKSPCQINIWSNASASFF